MKILFLQKRILFPPNTGGRIRTLNVVRYLARWHDLTYLCNLQPAEEEFVPSMHELGLRLITLPWCEAQRGSLAFYGELLRNVWSPYPYTVDKDFDPALRARAAELLAREPFDLVICDFVQMARNALGLAAPAALLFEHNVEAEIFDRHARTDRGWLRRRYMALQARKMRAFEARAGKNFHAVVAVSDRDREIFERQYGWRHVHVIDTAVDTEYYQPAGECAPDRVVFVGSLDWLPNEDGLVWFVSEVWPLVRRHNGRARFQIVGRNPSSAVRALSDFEGVKVVGTVPDTRPWLAGATVVVVPLRIGGGTRIKIFEAMAMGKAVVSTSIGAEGLAVTSGRDVLLADDPPRIAESICRLLADTERRIALERQARALVETRFSAETVARQFEQACLSAAAGAEKANTSQGPASNVAVEPAASGRK